MQELVKCFFLSGQTSLQHGGETTLILCQLLIALVRNTVPGSLEGLHDAYYVPDTVQDFITESEEREGLKEFLKHVSTESPVCYIYRQLDIICTVCSQKNRDGEKPKEENQTLMFTIVFYNLFFFPPTQLYPVGVSFSC